MESHATTILDGVPPVHGWNPLPGDAWAWWDGHAYTALSVGTFAPDHHRDLIEDWGARPVASPRPGWNPVPGLPGVWVLFDGRCFPLVARRTARGWVFIHNLHIDLPLPWARRARGWLIAWSVVAATFWCVTIAASVWAPSAGSGSAARQPCLDFDAFGLTTWIIGASVSIAIASAAIPLYRWAGRAFVHVERTRWAIGMSLGGVGLLLGLLAFPLFVASGAVNCSL